MLLLYPFALLYQLITYLRTGMYVKGWWKRATFSVPLISVGNLSVGGTGKTPHIEYLIRLLQPSVRVATLSRGYGRRTKGFLLAQQGHSAQDIGDEPLQFFMKFDVPVAVGEKRAEAVPKLLSAHPNLQAILLDDAYQHLPVKPQLNILLTDYTRPFCNDFVLPAGRLREGRHGAQRADIVIVTKCPSVLQAAARREMEAKLRPYLKSQVPVCFTSIQYGRAKAVKGKEEIALEGKKVLLVTGIANPKPLLQHLQELGCTVTHQAFSDHHAFSLQEAEKLCQQLPGQDLLLLTEKDAVKWKGFEKLIQNFPIYQIPIEIVFLEGKEVFDKACLSVVGKL